MYSPTGQKLGAYKLNPAINGNFQPFMIVTLVTSDQFFGSRRLAVMDQLGSVGTYYPWGENRGSTNPQDTWSFGTYWTDSVTGLDYANNRYYFNSLGRFMTPDPAGAGAASGQDPVSWNRYAYTGGDPVNRSDPSGLLFYPGYESCVANDAASDETAACPINDDDTSLYGEIGSCFASDNFTPSPSPYCQGPQPTQAPRAPKQPEPDKCHLGIRYSEVVINGVATGAYHTMIVGVDDTTGQTLGVIDGWPTPITLPTGLSSIVIPILTAAESANGYYNNANTSQPYVDTGSSTTMCATWQKLVTTATDFPLALYGGLTSNSNSLTTYLWKLAGEPGIGPPPVPVPGWNSSIWFF
jgi:RHS repeat-associated protein